MPTEKRFRYDAVVKDLFEKDRPTLFGKFADVEVREFLHAELPVVEERIADLLVRLSDESLLHVEFQSSNDRKMPFRMGVYGLLAASKYGAARVRQVVVYLGSAPMRMKRELDLGGIRVEYRLVDIREFDAGELLATGNPGDCALALLARGGGERLREILERACELPEPMRRRVFAQLTVLSGLRGESERLRMELKAMGVYIEVEKNAILREIREKGREEGFAEGRAETLRRLLEAKFGRPLPEWALTRLRSATIEEIDAWTPLMLAADTLDAVFKRS